jgi:sugar lactone lactonase YvrE
MYIVDEYVNSAVWKLFKNSVTPILIAGLPLSLGSNSSQLNYPQGVYIDSNQNLYVTDYYGYRVQKYINGSRNGVTIAGISASAGTALNQFGGLRYFAFDATETYMYVTDCDNNRIMRYLTNSTTGTNGTVVAGGTGSGNTNTQLNYPWGIYYLPSVSNYLFITNYYGHSVMKWVPGASSGVFIAGTPGVAGSSATTFNNPMGIKLDINLNMFVVDCNNHRVQMFCYNNQTGTTIAGTGTAGSSATQLNYPRGIAFDSSMNMYITDPGNVRIQKFLKI